jgi:hypothetical protein
MNILEKWKIRRAYKAYIKRLTKWFKESIAKELPCYINLGDKSSTRMFAYLIFLANEFTDIIMSNKYLKDPNGLPGSEEEFLKVKAAIDNQFEKQVRGGGIFNGGYLDEHPLLKFSMSVTPVSKNIENKDDYSHYIEQSF